MINKQDLLKEGTREDMVNYLLQNATIYEMAAMLADYIEKYPEQSVIINADDYNLIMGTLSNIFKVRGQRVLGNGEVVEERRGRPKATPAPPKDTLL